MSNPDLIGSAEAAQIIGCDRSNLSRWVAMGRMTYAMQLPGHNGAVLFTRDEVDRVAAEYAARRALPTPAGDKS